MVRNHLLIAPNHSLAAVLKWTQVTHRSSLGSQDFTVVHRQQRRAADELSQRSQRSQRSAGAWGRWERGGLDASVEIWPWLKFCGLWISVVYGIRWFMDVDGMFLRPIEMTIVWV